jgi:hypothetical protein
MNRPYDGEARTRFGQLKLELMRSIRHLKEEQQFFIVFFNEHPIPMPARGMEHAIPQNQATYLTWVAGVRAKGMTDPRPAVELALSMNPDVVYLLSDGTFRVDVQKDLARLRVPGTQVNTIAFGDEAAEPFMRQLAANNGGRFVFVP